MLERLLKIKSEQGRGGRRNLYKEELHTCALQEMFLCVLLKKD